VKAATSPALLLNERTYLTPIASSRLCHQATCEGIVSLSDGVALDMKAPCRYSSIRKCPLYG
jgi:hypothetical protein